MDWSQNYLVFQVSVSCLPGLPGLRGVGCACPGTAGCGVGSVGNQNVAF